MGKTILKGVFGELLLIIEGLIYLVVTFYVLTITYVGSEVVGRNGVGVLQRSLYRLNPLMLILGLLLFTALTVLCWEFLLKKQMLRLKSMGLGWFIVGILLLLVAGVALFFDILLAAIEGTGLFGVLESEFISAVQIFYPMIVGVGYPLVRTLIRAFKKRNLNYR